MNRKHCYLLVEGPQDVIFVGRLLQEMGLRTATLPDEVPARWQPFIDSAARSRDEAERRAGKPGLQLWQMFKPTCFLSDTHVVVVEQVGGNRTKFSRTLRGTLRLIDGGVSSLFSAGIIPDADNDANAAFTSAKQALNSSALSQPASMNAITAGPPKTGIFVLPNCNASGGLEEVLIECGRTVYPDLHTAADSYVQSVDLGSVAYTPDDMSEMRTPQGPVKAIVGSMSSVLKPGSTIQVSLLRDRWISPQTMGTPSVAALVTFLKSLCELP
jgi:hypothetical protein